MEYEVWSIYDTVTKVIERPTFYRNRALAEKAIENDIYIAMHDEKFNEQNLKDLRFVLLGYFDDEADIFNGEPVFYNNNDMEGISVSLDYYAAKFKEKDSEDA